MTEKELFELLVPLLCVTVILILLYNEFYPKYKFEYYEKHEDEILAQFKKYGYEEIHFEVQDLKHYFISPSKKWIIFSTDVMSANIKLWAIRRSNYSSIPFKHKKYFWEVKSAVKEISKIEMKMKIYNVNKKKHDILKDFQM